jgi:hypothetical protein
MLAAGGTVENPECYSKQVLKLRHSEISYWAEFRGGEITRNVRTSVT